MEFVVELLIVARTRRLPDHISEVDAEHALRIADSVAAAIRTALRDDERVQELCAEADCPAGASKYQRERVVDALDRAARDDPELASMLWDAVHDGLEPPDDEQWRQRGALDHLEKLPDLSTLTAARWKRRLRRWPRHDQGSLTVAFDSAAEYRAYPRLDVPDAILAGAVIEVIVGLTEHYDPALTVSGALRLPIEWDALKLTVEILVDPISLVIEGDSSLTLTITADDLYPSGIIRMRARTDPKLMRERTIRLIYRCADRIVGLASRTVVVTATPCGSQSTPPPRPHHQMLDLTPLVESTPPDLVMVVFRADESEVFVWEAYPFGGHVTLSDGERRGRIDDGARDLLDCTAQLTTAAGFGGRPGYQTLVGFGDLVHDAIPAGIRIVLRDLIGDRADAPFMLLLTDEVFVPWELAVLDPPLHTPFGGGSPFLGAHVALSRWPFHVEGGSAGVNRQRHPVVTHAVVTADYEGQLGWRPLTAAVEEGQEFERRHGPGLPIEPTREGIMGCLVGDPAVDLLHVAMHGAYDPRWQQDGLVLPDPLTMEPIFLDSLAVRGLRHPSTGPFVFLNACRLGAGNEVLRSNAGFAAAVLRTGAVGVVAPIWNVDDAAAARLAAEFYESAYGDPAVPVAEMIRRARAGYTVEAIDAGEADTPTRIAYLAFGHPRLTLLRQRNREE